MFYGEADKWSGKGGSCGTIKAVPTGHPFKEVKKKHPNGMRGSSGSMRRVSGDVTNQAGGIEVEVRTK